MTDKIEEEVCDKCINEDVERHICPFQADVNEDFEFTCKCCDICTDECKQRI